MLNWTENIYQQVVGLQPLSQNATISLAISDEMFSRVLLQQRMELLTLRNAHKALLNSREKNKVASLQ